MADRDIIAHVLGLWPDVEFGDEEMAILTREIKGLPEEQAKAAIDEIKATRSARKPAVAWIVKAMRALRRSLRTVAVQRVAERAAAPAPDLGPCKSVTDWSVWHLSNPNVWLNEACERQPGLLAMVKAFAARRGLRVIGEEIGKLDGDQAVERYERIAELRRAAVQIQKAERAGAQIKR